MKAGGARLPRRQRHADRKRGRPSATAPPPPVPTAPPPARAAHVPAAALRSELTARAWSRDRLGPCAGAWAFALGVGLPNLLTELAYHSASPRQAAGDAGVAVAVGVALGVWLPRRIIRRRAAEEEAAPGTPAHHPGGLDFITTLAGILAFGMSVLWVLLGLLTASLEGWRAWLSARFVHPPWLTHLLLRTPVLGGLVLLGAGSALLLAVLHAWQRLAARRRTVWPALLSGATVAAAAAMWIGPRPGRELIPPLACCAAALLAVLPKGSASDSRPGDPAAAHAPGPARGAWFATGLGAVLLCAAALVCAPSGTAPVTDWGATGLVLAGAVLLGLACGAVAPRLHVSAADGRPLLLALLAIAWATPYGAVGLPAPAGDLARLGAVACLATAGAVIEGQRRGRSRAHAPRALGGVLVAWAVGLAAAALLTPQWLNVARVETVAVLIALALTAGAGIGVAFQRVRRRAARIAGLLGIGSSLAVVLLAAEVPQARDADATGQGSQAAARQQARALLAPPGARVAIVDDAAAVTRGARAWDLDLAGPTWDAIVLGDSSLATLSAGDATRLLRRCRRGLLPGGHVVIELPAAGFGPALFAGDASETHYLKLATPAGCYEALILGRDVPAWLGAVVPADASPELYRVRTWAGVQSLRSAAARP